MSQHTTLPWRLDRHGCIKGGIFREYTDGSSQDQIAMVCIPGENNGDQNANGELIVRAVNSHAELLAALQELAETSWTDTQDGTEPDLVLYRRFVERTAREAIAKAKGNQA